MDSRTRLAIGGMSTVAASIAVVCAVAMTTSTALADSPGAAVQAPPVVVPSSGASPSPAPTLTAAPVTPATSTTPEPQTVPAPAPEDVAAPAPTQPEGDPSEAIEDELVAEVAVSGSWDAVYAWAESRGWPAARASAWIARMEAKIADRRDSDGRDDNLEAERPGSSDVTQIQERIASVSAESDETSGRELSGSSFGSKREQSRVPPD